MGSVKSGPRKGPPVVELSKEFRYTNYRETIERMAEFGICSKGKAEEMIERVDALYGEASE